MSYSFSKSPTYLASYIALLMRVPTESATTASEMLPAALKNTERLDDAKESTLDKGETVQYVLDDPPPEMKRLRNLESVIEASLRITSNQFTIGRFLPRGDILLWWYPSRKRWPAIDTPSRSRRVLLQKSCATPLRRAIRA